MTEPDAAWDDPDRAVQIEDDNPESLAGGEVEFEADVDEDVDGAIELHDRIAVGMADLPQNLPSTPQSSDAGVENSPAPGDGNLPAGGE